MKLDFSNGFSIEYSARRSLKESLKHGLVAGLEIAEKIWKAGDRFRVDI